MMNIPDYSNLEKFVSNGRFALIKLKNEKEALRLYLGKSKIQVLLSNGKKGSPYIIPGGLLKKYLEEI